MFVHPAAQQIAEIQTRKTVTQQKAPSLFHAFVIL
jgi:hypothetical protein